MNDRSSRQRDSRRARWLPLALLLASLLPVVPAAAVAQEGGELVAETRRQLDALASLGPRPSGSEAAGLAAEYLGRQLAGWGWQVEFQEGIGTNRYASTAGRVTNVIGWLPATAGADAGGQGDALMLSAHYDSVVDGPGAMDNAASVASVLVAARLLAEAPDRARPAIVLFSDGEERYLLGAELFARESPLAARVGAIVNLDHSGRAGPLHAFELASPNGAMLQAVGEVAGEVGNVRAWSFAGDIYRLLPFNTDFTVFGELDVPGVNLAFTRDGYAYHTGMDTADGIPPATLATMTGVVHGLAQRFVVEGEPVGGDRHHPTFFSLGDRVVVLPAPVLWGLALLLVALGAWVVVGGFRRSRSGMLRSWLALFLALPLAVLLSTLLVVGLRAIVGSDQVAYANPWPLFGLLAAAALVSLLLVGRIAGARADAGVRLAAVTAAWLLWSLLFVLAAPGSAAFFLLPLAGLLGAAAIVRRWPGPGGTAAALVLLVALALAVWAEPLGILLPLLATTIPKAGPEPLLFWPVLIAMFGVLLGGLLWFAAARRAWGRGLWGVALLGLVVGTGIVLATPPYDDAHPQRVWRFHVSGPGEPYQLLASVDQLAEAGAANGEGPELEQLFWIDAGWWRAPEPAGPALPRPQVSFSREGETLHVDVLAPPGSDFILLQLPREGIEDSMPPAPREGTGPLVLRWVVEEGKPARFSLVGDIPPGTGVRAMSVTPAIDGTAAAAAPGRNISARTITYTDATVPSRTGTEANPEGER